MDEREWQDEFGNWYGVFRFLDDISGEVVPAKESFQPGAYKEKRDKMMADGTWGKKAGKGKIELEGAEFLSDKDGIYVI
jgi:hypothetical protein